MKPIYAALTLACLSATVTLARPAHAEPPTAKAQEEGRTHFTRGVALFKDADFRAALIEFKKAYEIAPRFRNMASSAWSMSKSARGLVASSRAAHAD